MSFIIQGTMPTQSLLLQKYLIKWILQIISVTFARKDNSLRINRLVGLLENWVTR